MSFCPFKSEDLAAAKGVFAEALFRENKKSPFGADPFKVALSIWPEETGELPKALWVAHSARWHEDAEVIEMLSDLEEESQSIIAEEKLEKAAEIETPEFKKLVKAEMIAELRDMMKNRLIEAKDRTGAMDRLSKLMGLDEKPSNADADASRVLGVIHHRLAPMNEEEYANMARQQQSELQETLRIKAIELEAEDARVIN